MPHSRSIDILKEARQQLVVEHQRALAEIDRDIARLEQVVENEPATAPTISSNGGGGSGRYRHMSMRSAVESFMSGFPQGAQVPILQITEALRDGQVMIGKKPNQKRLPNTKDVRILVSNSGRKKYVYDRVTDAVMLAADELRHAS
jgi:hypothetical protein